MESRVIAFDFDGVIHSYLSGWQGETNIPDPPVPGIKEVIDKLHSNGFEVAVISSRANTADGAVAIGNWLRENQIQVDVITSYKIPARCYIDDRAINFNPEDVKYLFDKIVNFKTWKHNVKDKAGVMDAIDRLLPETFKSSYIHMTFDDKGNAILTIGNAGDLIGR